MLNDTKGYKLIAFILPLKRLFFNNRAWLLLCLLIVSGLSAALVYGTERELDTVGICERLGKRVPLDLTFQDESGSEKKLDSLIDRPTILSLVYYRCEHICPQVLAGLAGAISRLTLVPDKDYRVITLSFDPKDSPEKAREVKYNYIKAINRPFPEDAWKFLTGDSENIRKITDALGFRYKKVMHGFIHPVVLIILSPDGKITRYITVSKYLYGVAYPVNFSKLELNMSLTDALHGRVYPANIGNLFFGFPHKPENQDKFFSMMKISGVITTVLLIAFFIYLRKANKRIDEGAEHGKRR